MALFSRTKKQKDTKGNQEITSKKANLSHSEDLSIVLSSPRITEKASLSGAHNAYVFNVAKTATKGSIKRAVREMYNVQPKKINIVVFPSKNVIVRGKRGVKGGGKKAYVYLSKGDKIDTM